MTSTPEAKPVGDDHRKVFDLNETVQDWDDDYYHPIAEGTYDRAIPWMLTAMGAGAGDLVLDAGCGPGVHSIRAARHGCRVEALDISKTMLAHANQRAEEAGCSDAITFRHADLTRFEADQDYPFVFSWGVVIHIPEIDDVIENLAASVASGGSLALQVLSARSADFLVERAARRLLGKPFQERVDVDLGVGNWYEMNGERLWVLRFDIKALDAKLATLGFERTARKASDFTEFQRRTSGGLRRMMLRFNALMARANLVPSWAATQILVYKKVR